MAPVSFLRNWGETRNISENTAGHRIKIQSRFLARKVYNCMGNTNVYVLFTIHTNIMRVFISNLMYKFFILIHLLYSCTCFEHYCAHFQQESWLVQHLVSSVCLGDCSLYRLPESSHNLLARTDQIFVCGDV